MNKVVSLESIEQFLNPLLSSMGYELVDVQWVTDNHGRTLRILVDRESGITLDHCSSLSREIGTNLDVQDFIPGKYYLEISSPGLDRPLKKKNDFKRFLGHTIYLQTKSPIEGRSRYKGLLEMVQEDKVLLEIDHKEYWVPFEEIAKANLVY